MLAFLLCLQYTLIDKLWHMWLMDFFKRTLDTRRQIVRNAASNSKKCLLTYLCESENLPSDYVFAGMVSSFCWGFWSVSAQRQLKIPTFLGLKKNDPTGRPRGTRDYVLPIKAKVSLPFFENVLTQVQKCTACVWRVCCGHLLLKVALMILPHSSCQLTVYIMFSFCFSLKIDMLDK